MLQQVITVKTGEGLGSKDNWHTESVLQTYAPHTVARFQASLQQHDRFSFVLLNWIHVPVALLATAFLPVIIVALRFHFPEISVLAFTALFALLSNAAVCGVFSSPGDRYQSRIIPLAILPVSILAMSWLTRGRRPKQRSTAQEGRSA